MTLKSSGGLIGINKCILFGTGALQNTHNQANTNYDQISNNGSNTTTESLAQQVMPISGYFSNIKHRVTANASTTNANTTIRVNGVSSACFATIIALTTGIFSSTGSVRVEKGDLVNWEYQITTTSVITTTSPSVEFDPS